MKRREFIIGAACGVGAVWTGWRGLATTARAAPPFATQVRRFRYGDAR